MDLKRSWIAKVILRKMSKTRDAPLPDGKVYYKTGTLKITLC